MKFEIKHRLTANVLFECEADSFKMAVELAVKNKVSLQYASLQGASLQDANLQGANLRGANLQGANLQGANLQGANLQGANLQDASLQGANLQYANLQDASLQGANLQYASLQYANLDDIKKDYFERLALAKNEVTELYKAILMGRINGSAYEGECACFCGTIANIRKEKYEEMTIDLRPDSHCPTEKWFLGIRQGDTPAVNQISKITAEWTEEFMRTNEVKIPQMQIVWE